MAKPNPIAMLAEQLVRTLREARDRGLDGYPTTRSALVALAAPNTSSEDLAKAFKKKPFATSFILAHKSDANSPIALVEDVERLATCPLLLEFALGLICTPQKPAHPPANVVKKIDKALQPAFAAALERRLADKDWPEPVGVVDIKNKPHLFLKRMPPPPPPPALALAAKLLEELQRLKQADRYPATLATLVQGADSTAAADLVRKALTEKSLKGRIIVALANHLDSPVAFVEDRVPLAASPLLLETVLAANRTASNQAIPANSLEKKLEKSLRKPFADHLDARVEQGELPTGVGCLRIKTKPHLFLWSDAGQMPRRAAPLPPPVPTADFAARFDETFTRLDGEKGASNFLSLVELRRALPVERSTFDVGLEELRRAGRYTLSGAEGRHGVSDEEREAGIREEGTLLLYVSRRQN